MRLIAGIALSGLVFIGTIEAQSLAEHAAAAAGATVGTAAGKPMSNAITKIFGQVDDQTKSASRTNVKPVRPAADPTTTGAAGKPSPAGSLAGTEPLPPGPAPSGAAASSGSGSPDELTEPTPARPARSASRRRRQQETASIDAPALPPAPAPVAAPLVPAIQAVKEPTLEEVANIQVGANEKDVVTALGAPASHTIIPDDDGHLRETLQYWANGSPIGTIRLDNGSVVKVETRKF